MNAQDTGPKVHKITRRAGVAGQFEVTAAVEYPAGETRLITFVGSTYGGPVVMVLENGTQMFVTDPGRFGEFGESWVRKFFEQS